MNISMKLRTENGMDHQQYLSHTSFWPLASISPFAIATYLSCALDSNLKCYHSLRKRLPEIEKDIVTANSSKEKRKLKRIRYHVNRDIRLCCSEMETLMGAMDSVYQKMNVHYQQKSEHYRNSWTSLQQCLNECTFPTYDDYTLPTVPALWQHQSTSWGPVPYNFDPYAAVAPQYVIREGLIPFQFQWPTFQYPCSDHSVTSSPLYDPNPIAVARFPHATEGQSATARDLTESMSVLSPSLPLTNSTTVSRRSSKIELESSTANSPEKSSLDDSLLPTRSRRYSSTAIDLLLYHLRTSCHRPVRASEPKPHVRGGSVHLATSY